MSLFCLDNNPCSEKGLVRFCKLIATKICHREKKNGKNVWGLFTVHSTLFSTIKLSFVFCNTSSVFALTLLAANAKLAFWKTRFTIQTRVVLSSSTQDEDVNGVFVSA